MKKLLQIDACLNSGSTGRITEDIAKLAMNNGWDCYIIHGARYVNHPSVMHSIQPGSVRDEYLHYAEYFFFDNDGLASRNATRRLINIIEKIGPNIIQLHDIHDHWLNYKLLFEYINTLDIPIVWTQHDCWSFTGDCGHFSTLGCNEWQNVCTRDCPMRKMILPRKLINHTTAHFNIKKKWFSESGNLTLVTVSKWLEGVLKESFLKNKRICTIYNGIDTSVFRPNEDTNSTLRKYGLDKAKYVVGVATAWTENKGIADYCKLSIMIPKEVKIVLVGLDKRNRKKLSQYGIIGISRTENVDELVALYNGASIVMNLSYEETFGLTTVEGLACGTPSIVYNATASPELVTPETGIIVEPGDIDGVAKAIRQLLSKEKPVKECRERAMKYYNKEDRYQEYINLYEKLIKE